MDREAQVEIAAEHLDIHMPGWASKINIETLRLESLCNCVLGQLFPDDEAGDVDTSTPYRRGFYMLDLNWEDDPLPGVPDGVFADDEGYLDLWKSAIMRRRGEQAATVQGETTT